MFTSLVSEMVVGEARPLYARLDGQGTPEWRVLGTIARTESTLRVDLHRGAEVCGPAWAACALDACESDRVIRQIAFGMPVAGQGVQIIGRSAITRRVLAECMSAVRTLGRVPAARGRRARSFGFGSRPVRTSWPAWLCGKNDQAERQFPAPRPAARPAQRRAA